MTAAARARRVSVSFMVSSEVFGKAGFASDCEGEGVEVGQPEASPLQSISSSFIYQKQ